MFCPYVLPDRTDIMPWNPEFTPQQRKDYIGECEEHYKQLHREAKYKCQSHRVPHAKQKWECDFQTTDTKAWRDHQQNIHDTYNEKECANCPHKCADCGRTYATPSYLDDCTHKWSTTLHSYNKNDPEKRKVREWIEAADSDEDADDYPRIPKNIKTKEEKKSDDHDEDGDIAMTNGDDGESADERTFGSSKVKQGRQLKSASNVCDERFDYEPSDDDIHESGDIVMSDIGNKVKTKKMNPEFQDQRMRDYIAECKNYYEQRGRPPTFVCQSYHENRRPRAKQNFNCDFQTTNSRKLIYHQKTIHDRYYPRKFEKAENKCLVCGYILTFASDVEKCGHSWRKTPQGVGKPMRNLSGDDKHEDDIPRIRRSNDSDEDGDIIMTDGDDDESAYESTFGSRDKRKKKKQPRRKLSRSKKEERKSNVDVDESTNESSREKRVKPDAEVLLSVKYTTLWSARYLFESLSVCKIVQKSGREFFK